MAVEVEAVVVAVVEEVGVVEGAGTAIDHATPIARTVKEAVVQLAAVLLVLLLALVLLVVDVADAVDEVVDVAVAVVMAVVVINANDHQCS